MTDRQSIGDEIDLRAYGRTAYKWSWPLGAVILLVLLGSAVHAFTATAIYSATTTLLLAADAPTVVTFEEVVRERQTGRPEYLQTQYSMLRSRSLAQRTIERLDLWDHPEFSPAGDIAAEESAAAEQNPNRRRRVVTRFLEGLSVDPVRDSRMVRVAFRATDPVLATRVANTLASEHIARDREYRGQSSQEASAWLGQRIDDYRERVATDDLALQQYREEHGTVSLEDSRDIVVQDLARLTELVTRASTDRILKESRYRQVESIRNDAAALGGLPEVQQNTFIQNRKARVTDLQREAARLEENYGDRHPRMIEARTALEAAEDALQAEIANLVDSLHNEYLTAEAQEQALQAELEARNREALALNRAGLEYGVLRRESETNLQIYDVLLRRANETGVTGELQTSNIRVIDAAEVPLRPASPNRPQILLAGLVGGVSMALMLVLVIERFDNRLTLPEEVTAHLGLSVLGTMPVLDDAATAPRGGGGDLR